MRKLLKIHFIYILMFNILFIGCSNNEYHKVISEFNQLYLNVGDAIELEDKEKTLKNINQEEISKTISEMKNLLDNTEPSIFKDKRQQYEALKEAYEGVAFLKYVSQQKWDDLSKEDKNRVYSEIRKIYITKDIISRGDWRW